ncbi:D(1A) dopamine receptor-like [Amphiura filiformis]|uniref:D(1A) dopamine receptor-like n=1 Tax=Amphiura filiformis TaxID=82378 RepID=UPI003B21E8C6
MVHNGSVDSSLDSTISSATDTVALSSDGFRIAALCIIPLLDLYGIIGNTFVCIAVVRFPNLRTVGNFYILSLAIADLLVCTVVMPLSIYQEVTNGVWRLPVWLCDLWTSLDVLLSTASIWLLCVISLDRYFAITKPHSYATKRTWVSAMISVSFAWIISFLLSVPVLIFVGGSDVANTKECYVVTTPAFAIAGPITSFYLPCFIVLAVYWQIFQATRRLQLRRVAPQNSAIRTVDGTGQSIDQGNSTETSAADSTNKISIKREKKAAFVLAIVVGVFIICWLPFFIVFLLFEFCEECHVQGIVFKILTWLGWCNSILNPLIYTIFNSEFRKAFKKIIFLK